MSDKSSKRKRVSKREQLENMKKAKKEADQQIKELQAKLAETRQSMQTTSASPLTAQGSAIVDVQNPQASQASTSNDEGESDEEVDARFNRADKDLTKSMGSNRATAKRQVRSFVDRHFKLYPESNKPEDLQKVKGRVNYLVDVEGDVKRRFALSNPDVEEGARTGMRYMVPWLPQAIHDTFLKPGQMFYRMRESFAEGINRNFICIFFAMVELNIREVSSGERVVSLSKKENLLAELYGYHCEDYDTFFSESKRPGFAKASLD
ncbi:hypothetical protein BJ508DRAFT_336422 [Ascobolus immersus RN42]|uniref:DUF6532 domain-containing protein n=1 Tax=Ascobolus immersus RN42 TaxID=1160509 RepID=A0A3N4H8M5_ASCIM|nr:hypothetical protein BJ508DRAFT_336422 [Ascobolus immersus RN42]